MHTKICVRICLSGLHHLQLIHAEETQRMNPYHQWYRCISCKSRLQDLVIWYCASNEDESRPWKCWVEFQPSYVNPFTAKGKLDSTKKTSKSWTIQRNLKVSTLKWPGWESYQDLAKILRDHAWLAKILARFKSVIFQDLAGDLTKILQDHVGSYKILQDTIRSFY